MTAAIYLRLSSEDNNLKSGGKAESESISNQRGLLRNYLRSRGEFAGYEIIEFCDDGWSGKNFERPGFKAMIEEARKGKIDAIIVKDFSRFGRDYLTVGNYISRVFPFLGVRFISVNDNFDSIRPQDIDSLDTSFKTLIYDLYSRELSAKVKSAKRQRAEKGLYLSPFAPYGFIKDPNNKNRLLVDEQAAETVRRIFTLTADETGAVEIAAMLNRDHVKTPMLFKRASGCSRGCWPSVHEENCWTANTVDKILRDERYIGKCVYGKRERNIVGNQNTVRKDRSDWIVVENTHEGLVSKDLFDRAQSKMREYRAYVPQNTGRNLLPRKVICGVCGYAMRLTNTKNARYECGMARFDAGFGKFHGSILQKNVHELAVTLIRTYAACAVEMEQMLTIRREKRQADRRAARRQLGVLQGRKGRLEAELQELYERLIGGEIGKDGYLARKAELNKKIAAASEEIAGLESMSGEQDEKEDAFIQMYRKYTELDTLTPEVARDLIRRVVVYPGDEVEIELALRDEFDAATKLCCTSCKCE